MTEFSELHSQHIQLLHMRELVETQRRQLVTLQELHAVQLRNASLDKDAVIAGLKRRIAELELLLDGTEKSSHYSEKSVSVKNSGNVGILKSSSSQPHPQAYPPQTSNPSSTAKHTPTSSASKAPSDKPWTTIVKQIYPQFSNSNQLPKSVRSAASKFFNFHNLTRPYAKAAFLVPASLESDFLAVMRSTFSGADIPLSSAGLSKKSLKKKRKGAKKEVSDSEEEEDGEYEQEEYNDEEYDEKEYEEEKGDDDEDEREVIVSKKTVQRQTGSDIVSRKSSAGFASASTTTAVITTAYDPQMRSETSHVDLMLRMHAVCHEYRNTSPDVKHHIKERVGRFVEHNGYVIQELKDCFDGDGNILEFAGYAIPRDLEAHFERWVLAGLPHSNHVGVLSLGS